MSPWVQNNPFLLSARKRKKQKKSNYLISLDEEDLAKNSGNYYGKVKSNFVGTEFVMHDKGVKPADAEQTPVANLRKELGCVLYARLCSAFKLSDFRPVSRHKEVFSSDLISLAVRRRYDTNVLGTKGPRKMTVVVPPVSPEGLVQATTDEGMLDRIKEGDFGEAIKLHNKVRRRLFFVRESCLRNSGLAVFLSLPDERVVLMVVRVWGARRRGGTSRWARTASTSTAA